MSGYLHSLAAHGRPPGPRLHPIAVPFTRAALATDDVRPIEIGAGEPPAPVDISPLSAEPPKAMDEARVDDRRSAPLTLAEVVVRLTDPPVRPAPVAPEPHHARPPLDPPAPAAPPATPGGMRQHTTAMTASLSAQPARARSTASDHQPRVTPAAAKTTAVTQTTPSRATARHGEGTRNRRDAAPDVHIHIGRIELTAVSPPAPARRQPAAVKPAMPLDEYLQRRNGRTR